MSIVMTEDKEDPGGPLAPHHPDRLPALHHRFFRPRQYRHGVAEHVEDLGLSPTQAGFVGLSLGLFDRLSGGGWLALNLGAKRTVLCCLLTWGLFSMATGFAPDFRALVVLRFLLGLAEGPLWTSLVALLSQWFLKSERGRAIGLWNLELALRRAAFRADLWHRPHPYGLACDVRARRLSSLVLGDHLVARDFGRAGTGRVASGRGAHAAGGWAGRRTRRIRGRASAVGLAGHAASAGGLAAAGRHLLQQYDVLRHWALAALRDQGGERARHRPGGLA